LPAESQRAHDSLRYFTVMHSQRMQFPGVSMSRQRAEENTH
jgi:hypothetical protein